MNRDALARHQEGVEHQQAGRLREAAEAYEEALSLDPRLELTRSNLAMVLFQLGQVDQAIFHLRTLLDAHPYNVKARYNLGGIYVSIGRYEEAITEYREVLTLESGHAMALHNLAWIFTQQKRYGEAIETTERLLELNPADTQVLFQLGQLHRHAGDMPQAETYWRTVVTLDPFHVQGLLCMADLQRSRQDWQGVLRWTLDALASEPHNTAAQIMAAQAHMALLEHRRAREILMELAEKHPQMAEVRYHLGVLSQNEGDLDAARLHLAEAARLDKHRVEIVNEYATVLFRLGEYAAAVEQFREAESLQPDNAIIKANLGFCYLHLGNRESAGRYFQAFLARPAAEETVRLSVQCALDLL